MCVHRLDNGTKVGKKDFAFFLSYDRHQEMNSFSRRSLNWPARTLLSALCTSRRCSLGRGSSSGWSRAATTARSGCRTGTTTRAAAPVAWRGRTGRPCPRCRGLPAPTTTSPSTSPASMPTLSGTVGRRSFYILFKNHFSVISYFQTHGSGDEPGEGGTNAL